MSCNEQPIALGRLFTNKGSDPAAWIVQVVGGGVPKLDVKSKTEFKL